MHTPPRHLLAALPLVLGLAAAPASAALIPTSAAAHSAAAVARQPVNTRTDTTTRPATKTHITTKSTKAHITTKARAITKTRTTTWTTPPTGTGTTPPITRPTAETHITTETRATTRARTTTRPTRTRTTRPTTTQPTTTRPTTTRTTTTQPTTKAGGGGGSSCGGTTLYKADGTTWVCTLDDEFNGSQLNTSLWTPQLTSQSALTGGAACFVNSPRNISVGHGMLALTVRQESQPFTCSSPGGNFTTSYTAGMVSTWNNFSQTYGRFDVRAKFPAATVAGLQSALWLWPQRKTYGSWPTNGEIDIAEFFSQYPDRAIPTLHYTYDSATVDPSTDTNIATNNYCMLDPSQFHTYSLEWSPNHISISYDGHVCLTDNYVAAAPLTGAAPFDQPFIVALSSALGIGTNAVTASTPLPATTYVDYVRVWQ
jgi:beta-glucanase (GH16 family)